MEQEHWLGQAGQLLTEHCGTGAQAGGGTSYPCPGQMGVLLYRPEGSFEYKH